MNSFKLQSFLFASVVLALTLTGKTESGVESGNLATAQVALPAPINKFAAKPVITDAVPNSKVLTLIRPEPEKTTSEPPMVKAEALLIAELENGYRLFEKNSGKRWPLASLTKLMTSVTALERMKADFLVTMSEAAASADGNAGNFKIGEVFSVADFVKAALIISSNDAAAALAGHFGERDFLNAMNDKATELGMTQTVFADATGLSALNQSSLEDMQKLVVYISRRHPQLLDFTSKSSAVIYEARSGAARVIPSNNRFAGRPDFVGGKTGYTDDASGNLISVFTLNGRKIMIAVFGTPERFEATETLFRWVKKNFREP